MKFVGAAERKGDILSAYVASGRDMSGRSFSVGVVFRVSGSSRGRASTWSHRTARRSGSRSRITGASRTCSSTQRPRSRSCAAYAASASSAESRRAECSSREGARHRQDVPRRRDGGRGEPPVHLHRRLFAHGPRSGSSRRSPRPSCRFSGCRYLATSRSGTCAFPSTSSTPSGSAAAACRAARGRAAWAGWDSRRSSELFLGTKMTGAGSDLQTASTHALMCTSRSSAWARASSRRRCVDPPAGPLA